MSDLIQKLAHEEGIKPEILEKNLREGSAVLIKSRGHRIKPLVLGKGCRTKINANIGTSPDFASLKYELKKLQVAIENGADAVMDLSTGGDVDRIRREIVSASTVAIGTVPIYQVAIDMRKKKKPFIKASVDEIFDTIEKHLEDGVDFITVHCGITEEAIRGMARKKRVCGIVSRGGSMMIEWMRANKKENPLYEHYDRLLKLAKRYSATLSLGDGLRPGSISDATDEYQIKELVIIGELVKEARASGVSVIVEGPGHIPINEIEANIKLQKTICGGAPFYVLGPLVTDIGAGYDHIVAAIGGAIAGYHGADFLCYVTPSEHLGLPTVKDVKEGVIALKIAAHAADIGKGLVQARMRDLSVSKARFALDWDKMFNLLIDPKKAKEIFHRRHSRSTLTCTMCGEFCAMKKTHEIFRRS
ncbi:MAG: phosphomethylpyrimidine synthase ThiC [candidate division WOR-3 bacterium]|nr:phosphomethylpyrimidine synthase ThiC [candidate division WOR-3 bacterium]